MHVQNLFNTLNSIKPLTIPLKAYLSNNLIFEEFSKGELLPYNQPSSSRIMYFIAYGLVCGTKLSNNKKAVLWYSQDGNFIVPELAESKEKFIGRLEFQTPTLLIGFEFPIILEEMKLYEEARYIFLGIIHQNNRESHEREIFLRLSAENRVKSLMQSIPMIFFKSKTDYMASYINISVAHYHKIKKADLKVKK